MGLIGFIAIATGGWVLGWVGFSDSGSDASVTIHKDVVAEDTQDAIKATERATKEVVAKAKDVIGQAGDAAEPTPAVVEPTE